MPSLCSFPFSCCLPKAAWPKAPRVPEEFNSQLAFHREKKISRSSALKVLDHAMIGPEGTDNCHKFVDILGLRTIFPLFMKSPKKIKKVGTTEKEHEGRRASRSPLSLRSGGAEGERLGSARAAEARARPQPPRAAPAAFGPGQPARSLPRAGCWRHACPACFGISSSWRFRFVCC